MTDVDRLDLVAQELGFVLKSEEREALELLPTGFNKSLIYQMFFHAKSSSSSVQRPTVVVLACIKKGIDRKHTTFTSCQNAACSNEHFSLSGRKTF